VALVDKRFYLVLEIQGEKKTDLRHIYLLYNSNLTYI
jgi:hypothetical protein